jgi:hypothetical protein
VLAPVLHAEPKTEAERLGNDLIALYRAGLSSPYLWDVYGTLSVPATKSTPERRAYAGAARVALGILRLLHLRSRNGTHFRLAGAILREMVEAPPCRTCLGLGRFDLEDADGLGCPHCGGSGLRRASMTWRVNATECHYTDFRDRLQGVYQVTLTYLAACRRDAIGRSEIGRSLP